MKGNTIGEFIDDLLLTGGPEKEFTFRTKYFFLETTSNRESGTLEMALDEYDNTAPENKKYICTHSFAGDNFAECVAKFENAEIFDGMTIYQAEQEVEVLFG